VALSRLMSLLAMFGLFFGTARSVAATSTLISVSTVSDDGVRLTLMLPRSVYLRNALVRATVRIQNVGQHTVFTRIGDGCTSTNPFIEVFDLQGRIIDQGPSVTFDRAGGCKHVLGQPFTPGQVAVRHIFAVLRGRYLRAVLTIGKNLHGQDVSAKLAVRLIAGEAPVVTIDQTGEPFVTVRRPAGATGPLHYSGSALCGTATDPQTTQVDLLWSPVSSTFHSGCLQTREWHGLVGYLNYPVVSIDWKSD
jgi:hypothetical protein